MKILLTIACMFAANQVANADTCLDFSGNYEESASKSELSISQASCSSLTLTYVGDGTNEIQNFVLDGQKYKMLETPEATWWAKAAIAGNREDIIVENETIFANGKKANSIRRLHLDYTYAPGKTYLLDQRGKLHSNGIFVPSDSTTYVRK